MAGASLADRCRRILARPRVTETWGAEAAGRLIDGDPDGALRAAERLKTARDPLVRSEGYTVLAWVHLVRREYDRAEAAASLSHHRRVPDPLLIVALIVASGGPSAGAATALANAKAVLSMVGATRVLADHDKLGDVRAEIGRLPPKGERAALEALKVGLVASDRATDVDEVTKRLSQLGATPRNDVLYASSLGVVGMTERALRYLQVAADHGFVDLDLVMSDPNLADARSQPAFTAAHDLIIANAGQATSDAGS